MGKMEDKLIALAEQVAPAHGVEVDDVELMGQGKWKVVRVILEKPGGVTLGDCSAFSRDLSALLEVEDPIKGRYSLEVSSPGLDRPLKRLRHFEKYVDKKVRVVTRDGRAFVAVIKGVEDGSVVLEHDGQRVALGLDEIVKARLEIEI